MRVFILAIDGLDYNLVIRWSLKNLMQKKCGIISLSPEYYLSSEKIPYTPIIWGSFITGRRPHEHGAKLLLSTNINLLNIIRRFPVIKYIKGKRDLLEKIGISPWIYMHIANKNDLGIRTMFDIIKNSVAIWVPAYNPRDDLYWSLREAIKKGIKEYESTIWHVHKIRYLETIKQLKNTSNWELFMTYFDLADLLGHLYISKKRYKLYIAYKKLDKLAGELKLITKNNTFFLIVSDHGMLPGKDGLFGVHSNYAFWSYNLDLEWIPKDITDFYYKIMNLIKK